MQIQVRTDDEWNPTCGWTTEEVEHYLMGPFDGGVPGLVRRIRRILDVSQRGLAALIGVSQSVVARWETGRTSPRVSAMQQLLRLARLGGTVHDTRTGVAVEPMRDDGARDRGGRRYPAHVDLTVTGWYVPRGLDCTADPGWWRERSRTQRQPRVRYDTSPYLRWRWRGVFGTPVDHPASFQLVAEARHLDDDRQDRLERLRTAWLRGAGPSPHSASA
ncbi:MAG: helix-turn-helix transcriptional regulator [Nocardioides sp.]